MLQLVYRSLMKKLSTLLFKKFKHWKQPITSLTCVLPCPTARVRTIMSSRSWGTVGHNSATHCPIVLKIDMLEHCRSLEALKLWKFTFGQIHNGGRTKIRLTEIAITPRKFFDFAQIWYMGFERTWGFCLSRAIQMFALLLLLLLLLLSVRAMTETSALKSKMGSAPNMFNL